MFVSVCVCECACVCERERERERERESQRKTGLELILLLRWGCKRKNVLCVAFEPLCLQSEMIKRSISCGGGDESYRHFDFSLFALMGGFDDLNIFHSIRAVVKHWPHAQ